MVCLLVTRAPVQVLANATTDSSVKTQLAAAVADIGVRLGNDAAMRQWIDETIERMATVLVERNREKVGRFIADQVGAWDDKHMVEQVELNIGKDLQFIRINGTLVGGSVVIETVFAWPGLGRLTFDSVLQRDYPLMLGIFLVMSVIVISLNLITDTIYRIVDPRVSLRAAA